MGAISTRGHWSGAPNCACAEIEFVVVVVAGEPIVEVIPGTAVREDDRWMLSADSFCRLIATGGIECPADLARPG